MRGPYCTKQVMIGEEYMIMRFSKINILQQLLPQVENVFDLRDMGVQNDFPTVKSCASQLERKGKVNSQMKKRNTIESIPSQRVIVEHTVSRIKKFGENGMKI